MKFKIWLREHWDEVMVIVGTILGFYLILKANGATK